MNEKTCEHCNESVEPIEEPCESENFEYWGADISRECYCEKCPNCGNYF